MKESSFPHPPAQGLLHIGRFAVIFGCGSRESLNLHFQNTFILCLEQSTRPIASQITTLGSGGGYAEGLELVKDRRKILSGQGMSQYYITLLNSSKGYF